MHTLLSLALIALLCAASCAAQSFTNVALGTVNAGSVAGGDIKYIRAYAVQEVLDHIVLAEGFRAVGGIVNNTAGLAADLQLFAGSNFFDCALATAYYEAAAEASYDTSTGNLSVSWEAAGIAGAIRFFKLLEYVETNNVSGFQPGSGGDQVVGHYNLIGLPYRWNNWTLAKQTLSDGSVIFSATTSTTDNVFGMRAWITGNYTTVGQLVIDPTSLKFDIKINYYGNSLYTGPTLYASGPSSASLYPNAQLSLVTGLIALAGAKSGKLTYQDNNVSPLNSGVSTVTGFSTTNGAQTVFFNHQNYVNWAASGVTVGAATAGVVRVQSSTDPTASQTGLDAESELFQGMWANGWGAFAAESLQFFSYTGAVRPTAVEWDPQFSVSGVNSGGASQAPTTQVPPPNSAAVLATPLHVLLLALVALFAVVFLGC